MASLLTIGECMMELKPMVQESNTSGGYSKTFAGDTYNSAVYAKRWHSELDVSFFSAVGIDPISKDMLNECASQGIDISQILITDTALLGIYLITTDERGERSFSYWRQNSAASQMMQLLDAGRNYDSIPSFDYVYFSGISLAILDDEDKSKLLELLSILKGRGAKIAFDPNYRPKMWRDLDHAKTWVNKAYSLSDLVFPGLEDHEDLFAHSDQTQIKNYLDSFDVDEIVIKCGESGVYAYSADGADAHQPFSPAQNQVDSTAAGDSFAGTYLASRLAGKGIAGSIKAAADVAAFVVQHKGAIVDDGVYRSFITANK